MEFIIAKIVISEAKDTDVRQPLLFADIEKL